MGVSGWKIAAAVLLGVGAQVLTGCNGFFVYPGDTTTGSGSGGSTSTDYVFASSGSSGQISGYTFSGGTLSTATNSPFSVNYVPTSMVIPTGNQYLFVATNGAIYSYSIGSGGSLNLLSSTASSSESIAVSPDGQWLLGIESTGGASPTTYLDVYPITSGSISSATLQQTQIVSAGSVAITTPSQETIQISPSGTFVAVALGTGGAVVIPFTTSNGTFGSTEYQIGVPTGGTSSFSALAIDSNSYLYLIGTSNANPVIESYAVNATTGVPSGNATTTLAIGNNPKWVSTSTNGAYVYVANAGSGNVAGTISEFSTASGKLSSLGTVTSVPTNVSALGVDNTGNYLVALGYNTGSGLQPYTINSGGTLSAATAVGSGLGNTAVIAMSPQ